MEIITFVCLLVGCKLFHWLYFLLFKPLKLEYKLPLDIINTRGKLTFPYPHPPPYLLGWYKILDSFELARGRVKNITCFNSELVAFRDDKGIVTVLDGICPHLGANLGIGGKVKNSCLSCPFHGWEFDSSGQCVNIPYDCPRGKIPKTASLKKWPTREVNNCIYVWKSAGKPNDRSVGKLVDCEDYSAQEQGEQGESKKSDEQPTWEMPEVGGQKFSQYHGSASHDVTCHTQEIAENGSDAAHFEFVHTDCAFDKLFFIKHKWKSNWTIRDSQASVETKSERHIVDMKVSSSLTVFGLEISRSKTDVDIMQIGIGNVYLKYTSPLGEFLVIQSVLPISSNFQRISQVIYSKKYTPRIFAKLILVTTSNQIMRDVEIWNHKVLLSRPLLITKEDKPVVRFRRWVKQFYPHWGRAVGDVPSPYPLA